jgi:hypothetical protein
LFDSTFLKKSYDPMAKRAVRVRLSAMTKEETTPRVSSVARSGRCISTVVVGVVADRWWWWKRLRMRRKEDTLSS